MSVSRIGNYDGMPIFLADDLASFVAAATRGDMQKWLSIAFVLGDESQAEVNIAADVAARLAPVLVHCFGKDSERMHDSVDAALMKENAATIQTYWTVELDPTEIIFELCCTDLPSESHLDHWSGRLLVLGTSLDSHIKKGIMIGLRDIQATVKEAVRRS